MPLTMQAGAADNVIGRRSADAKRLAAFQRRIASDRTRSISALIEREIIPRLIIAHADDRPVQRATVPPAGAVEPSDLAALVPLSLEMATDALLAHVEAVLARGVPTDAVLVDLLAPAARMLGECWEQDRCDFVEVTMGLWRLQEVVRDLAARVPAGDGRADDSSRALFASMPGDQHSFGTVVIEEVFRHDGWQTDRLCEVETSDLLRRMSGEWFDLVGLTVSCDCHIAALGSIIVALRNVSRNPRVCVMVGGRVFAADPALAAQVGADGTARDAKLAVKLANALVRERAREAAACS